MCKALLLSCMYITGCVRTSFMACETRRIPHSPGRCIMPPALPTAVGAFIKSTNPPLRAHEQLPLHLWAPQRHESPVRNHVVTIDRVALVLPFVGKNRPMASRIV